MMGYCKKKDCGKVFKKETRNSKVCNCCKTKALENLIEFNKNRDRARGFVCAVNKKGKFHRFISAQTRLELHQKVKISGYKREGRVFYA